jgi:hypothetical protein
MWRSLGNFLRPNWPSRRCQSAGAARTLRTSGQGKPGAAANAQQFAADLHDRLYLKTPEGLTRQAPLAHVL